MHGYRNWCSYYTVRKCSQGALQPTETEHRNRKACMQIYSDTRVDQ